MPKTDDAGFWRKIKSTILDIDPEDVLQDARAAGLEVETIKDLRNQAHNYWRIEDIMGQYAGTARRLSAASGASSGFGGPATAITLGGVDLANIAAQLYRLNQRLAVLNGFDPQDTIQREKVQEIYLYSLGFDSATQTLIKQQLNRASKIAGKRGAYSNPVLKLIILIAEKLGAQITSKQAAKFIPLVGGLAGAGTNYAFANTAARKMTQTFKHEYFRTWQADQRN